MNSLWKDIRYGMRTLLRRRGFALIALLTLALGIGANTAIFSVVSAVLLRPLPFADPERLTMVWQTWPQGNWPQLPFSHPNFTDLREQSQLFESVAAWTSYSDTRFNLSGGPQPEQVQYACVSANLFSVLGVAPMQGRVFLADEDRLDAGRVAIISHGLWQRRFGSDQGLIGKTASFSGNSYTVVGIMPAGFVFPRFPRDAEVWVPLANDPNPGRRFSPGTRYLSVIARLKQGITLAQAQTEMNAIAQRIEEQRPGFNRGLGIQVTQLHRQITGNLRPALLLLLGAVGFVLLIACANVANLWLSRGVARQREMAVRAALGASRWRLVRQMLTEVLLLALIGGTVGLLFAQWGIDLLAVIPYNAASYFNPYNVQPDQITINGQVLGFTFALSLLAGLIFGLAPVFQVARQDIDAVLKGSSRALGSGSAQNRLRGVLVVGEITLSLVLLAGAGLMMRSFLRLQDVDPGFNPRNVLTAEISLPRTRYSEAQRTSAFYAQLLDRLSVVLGCSYVHGLSVTA
jgi:putative ABC transport system permease protein